MKQIVRKVKNGQEITFVCSKCGDFVHNVFIPTGKKYEDDWDKIPEKCSCGARLTNRQPIIDESDKDTDDESRDIYENAHENIRKNIENAHENIRRNIENAHKSARENPDTYGTRIGDLEKAISIDYFDMRLNSFKRSNFKLPDNVDFLRMECIKRNISHIESNMEKLSIREDANDEDGTNGKDSTDEKREMQKRLNLLRQKYDDLLEKLEGRKDVGRKDIGRKDVGRKDVGKNDVGKKVIR